MPKEAARDVKRKNLMLEKACYSRAGQKRLSQTEISLAAVRAQNRSATIAGHIVVTRQLLDAEQAVDANLAAVRAALEHLRKSSALEWKEHTEIIEAAWGTLSQSINRLVDGYPRGEE